VANPQDILIFSKSAKKRQTAGGMSLYFERNSASDIYILRKKATNDPIIFLMISFLIMSIF